MEQTNQPNKKRELVILSLKTDDAIKLRDMLSWADEFQGKIAARLDGMIKARLAERQVQAE